MWVRVTDAPIVQAGVARRQLRKAGGGLNSGSGVVLVIIEAASRVIRASGVACPVAINGTAIFTGVQAAQLPSQPLQWSPQQGGVVRSSDADVMSGCIAMP